MYEEYAQITAQEKELKLRKDVLKAHMLDDLKTLPGEKNDLGFSISYRKSYEYSAEIQNMSDDLKEAQLDEVEQKIATVKKTPYITQPK